MDVKKIPRKGTPPPVVSPPIDDGIIEPPPIKTRRPREQKKTDMMVVQNLDELDELKAVLRNIDNRLKIVENNGQLPDYVVTLLQSLLKGELKRCKNGKWPVKEQNVHAIAEYFKIKME